MNHRTTRPPALAAGMLALAGSMLGCSPEPAPTHTTRNAAAATTTREVEPEPESALIRYACAGFDRAIREQAPEDRLLSTSAKYAIELGGAPVEAATQRWALLPPQGLLELITRYERELAADPSECAGLRSHLERMGQRAATR
jgi:hypothetical protein